MNVSEADSDSVQDVYSGFELTAKVPRVEVEQISLVASGATLSGRILAAVGAAGCPETLGLDRAHPLPVLLQEGMTLRPLLVWTFPYSVYALPSYDRLVKGQILLQTPFTRLDLTLGVMSESVGGYLAMGDGVIAGLLVWLRRYAASKPGTDMADLAWFFRSYAEPSDRRVSGRAYPTQAAPRQYWHNTPHPAGLGGEPPPGLVAAVETRVRELQDADSGPVDPWVAYLHRRLTIIFGMPPERWAYTPLHLADYNGGRLPGLVDPGLSIGFVSRIGLGLCVPFGFIHYLSRISFFFSYVLVVSCYVCPAVLGVSCCPLHPGGCCRGPLVVRPPVVSDHCFELRIR